MPEAAESGLQEPEHELALVQQVQQGSITAAGTKALLTVKLPGVASADDVQVRCTSSSVSIAVPGRYMLQLPLPIRINDQAESVKFSSRKQPPTLTVTLAVEGSIQQQPAPRLPGVQPSTAAAASQNSSNGSRSTPRQRGQQQQQQPAAASHSSSSTPATQPVQLDIITALTAVGPMRSEDRSEWLLPFALAANWMEHQGASEALQSLLWTLSLYDLPADEDPQEDLVPLTLHNLVLALLGLLLSTIMTLLAALYAMGYNITQGCAYACVKGPGASRQLKPAYLQYLYTLNAAATALKLVQCCLGYSTLWRLLQLLRVDLLLGWLWRSVLWPVLVALLWKPSIMTTVLFCLLETACCGLLPSQPHSAVPDFGILFDSLVTHVLILVMGGGWLTVAVLLTAVTVMLPRLPKHDLWPHFSEWVAAVLTAISFIAPLWPHWWQRLLAYGWLAWFALDWVPRTLRFFQAQRAQRAWRAHVNSQLHWSSATVAAALRARFE